MTLVKALSSANLKQLFQELRRAGYAWQGQTPDRLLSFRKNPAPFRPLARLLGLGLPVAADELMKDGLSCEVLDSLARASFVRLRDEELIAEMAVSGMGDVFVVHDHWPPDSRKDGGYVHYAAESEWLGRACQRDLEGFIDKRVLDLGCSSGALAFEVAAVADRVLGLDISSRSIDWARATACALGFKNLRFETAVIGGKGADALASEHSWDIAIMNPPMVVPAKDSQQLHRDGGELGIALPLAFLDFSHRHLADGGEVMMLATNPIVHGRNAFFDRLGKHRWEFIEERCLHPQFNQSVSRKQNYATLGIQNIELWFLHLKKVR